MLVPGGYSKRSKQLAQEQTEQLKYENRNEILSKKQKIKELSKQTNAIRKKLEERKKYQENEEEERRQKILKGRKLRQQIATEKFQHMTDKQSGHKKKHKRQGSANGLRDGKYNVRGHIIEIQNGVRVSSIKPKKDKKKEVFEGKGSQTSAIFQNSVYAPNSYLSSHLNNLISDNMLDNGKQQNSENYTTPYHFDIINDFNKQHISNQTQRNESEHLKDQSLLTNTNLKFNKPPSPTDSVCSNDSLYDGGLLKSSLKGSSMKTLEGISHRKVTFSDSIEYNDGNTEPIRKKMTARIPFYKRIQNNEIVQTGSEKRREDGSHVTTEDMLDLLRQEALLPRYPINGDYNYPESLPHHNNVAVVMPLMSSNFTEQSEANEHSSGHSSSSSSSAMTDDSLNSKDSLEHVKDSQSIDELIITKASLTEPSEGDHKTLVNTVSDFATSIYTPSNDIVATVNTVHSVQPISRMHYSHYPNVNTSASMYPGTVATIIPNDQPFYSQPVTTIPNHQPFYSQPVTTIPNHQPFYSQPATTIPNDQPFNSQPATTIPTHQPFYSQPEITIQNHQPFYSQPVTIIPNDQPFYSQPVTTIPNDQPFYSQPVTTIPNDQLFYSQPATTIPNHQPFYSQPVTTIPNDQPFYSQPVTTLSNGQLFYDQQSYFYNTQTENPTVEDLEDNNNNTNSMPQPTDIFPGSNNLPYPTEVMEKNYFSHVPSTYPVTNFFPHNSYGQMHDYSTTDAVSQHIVSVTSQNSTPYEHVTRQQIHGAKNQNKLAPLNNPENETAITNTSETPNVITTTQYSNTTTMLPSTVTNTPSYPADSLDASSHLSGLGGEVQVVASMQLDPYSHEYVPYQNGSVHQGDNNDKQEYGTLERYQQRYQHQQQYGVNDKQEPEIIEQKHRFQQQYGVNDKQNPEIIEQKHRFQQQYGVNDKQKTEIIEQKHRFQQQYERQQQRQQTIGDNTNQPSNYVNQYIAPQMLTQLTQTFAQTPVHTQYLNQRNTKSTRGEPQHIEKKQHLQRISSFDPFVDKHEYELEHDSNGNQVKKIGTRESSVGQHPNVLKTYTMKEQTSDNTEKPLRANKVKKKTGKSNSNNSIASVQKEKQHGKLHSSESNKDKIYEEVERSLAQLTFEKARERVDSEEREVYRPSNYPGGEVMNEHENIEQKKTYERKTDDKISEAVRDGTAIPIRVHSTPVRRGRIIVSADSKKRREVGNFVPHPPTNPKNDSTSDSTKYDVNGFKKTVNVRNETEFKNEPPAHKRTYSATPIKSRKPPRPGSHRVRSNTSQDSIALVYPNNTQTTQGQRIALDKTPTDDEINKLWANVRECLHSETPDNAFSDSMCMVGAHPQQKQHGRTFSGSSFNRRSINKASPAAFLRQNSFDSVSSTSSYLKRQALLPQRANRLMTNSTNEKQKAQQKRYDNVYVGRTIHKPVAMDKYRSAVTSSMASFLALEEMCTQQSLSPRQTEAVFEASRLLQKKQNQNQPGFTALSIEEKCVMESLARINKRLEEQESQAYSGKNRTLSNSKRSGGKRGGYIG